MKTAILMSLVALMSLTAEAGRVRNREERQQKRIEEGVESGELTKKETKRLERQEKHIEKVREKDMADGKLSPKEKAHLEKMQDRESKRIYRQKHDAQTQPGTVANPGTAVAQPAASGSPNQ